MSDNAIQYAVPHAIGNPSKKTPERVARIIQAISIGCSDRTAAEVAGVEPVTFRTWCQHDPALKAQVNEARSKRKEMLIAHMVAGASGHDAAWNAARLQTALALLRAHEPEVWSQKAQVEHSGAIGIFQAAAATLANDDADVDIAIDAASRPALAGGEEC